MVRLQRRSWAVMVGASLVLFGLAACRREPIVSVDPAASGGAALGNGGASWQAPGGMGGAWAGDWTEEQPVAPTFVPTGAALHCELSINARPAPEMPTVGIVEFSVEGLTEQVTGAQIEYGTTTDYGLLAPVDLTAAKHRTLVLGMKPEREYHLRVSVSTASGHCVGPDFSMTTGGLRAGVLPIAEVKTFGTVTPGFVVGAQGPRAIIFDRDGDVVWGYSLSRAPGFPASCGASSNVDRLFAAKLSYDARYMLARDLGPFDCGDGGTFFRIALDGSSVETIDLPGGDHHDFSATPWGIAYIAKTEQGGDDQLFIAKSDGSDARSLVDFGPIVDAYPRGGGVGKAENHFNAVHYFRDRDLFTVSNRESDSIVAIDGSGEFVLGVGKDAVAPFSTMTAEATLGNEAGDEVLWRVQHGHDWYAPDKLVLFSNGDFMSGQAHALHYTLGDDGIAHLDWSYTGMGNSPIQGDVQHLTSGNFLVCASTLGFLQEIDPHLGVVAQYTAPAGGFGYVMQRASLYGRPPDGR